MKKIKNYLSKRNILIAGVDESGCGSLAGPVIAAAVILNPRHLIIGLSDSKILSKKQRLCLYKDIVQYALTWSIGCVSVEEIDYLNILQARLLAMKRAVDNLLVMPDLVLIDGNCAPRLNNVFYQYFIRGDLYIPVISAASIIAKVIRDQYMMILSKQYPEYGFNQNNGYPTRFHLKQLMLYGPTLFHRKSFAPIKHMILNRVNRIFML